MIFVCAKQINVSIAMASGWKKESGHECTDDNLVVTKGNTFYCGDKIFVFVAIMNKMTSDWQRSIIFFMYVPPYATQSFY